MTVTNFHFPDSQSCLNYILATFGADMQPDKREAFEELVRAYAFMVATDRITRLTNKIVQEAVYVG